MATAVEQPGVLRATIPRWAVPFLKPARYKSAAGGRGAGRTHTFSQLVVLRMAGLLPGYPPGPARIAMARQYQSSIADSCKLAVEGYIDRLGLSDQFTVYRYAIEHQSGSYAFFPGFSSNPRSLMSVEDLDVLWIEQAETVRDEMEIIIPSVRKIGSEIWFSWNPTERTQWCWQRFAVNPRPDDVIAWCNWNDNPWFPDVLDDERRRCLIDEPDRYPHVWGGMPDDGNAETQVLAYSLLRQCVDAYEDYARLTTRQMVDAGFDIAYGGRDQCALVVRDGPLLEHAECWPGVVGHLAPAVQRVHDRFTGWQTASMVYYDATGGDVAQGEFARLSPPYWLKAINFGGGVAGPKRTAEYGRSNADVFSRRNVQLAYALRLRANRTARLLAGDPDVDPDECLFINPDIPCLEKLLAEMAQPKRRVNPTSGKLEIDKRGEDDSSPDLFDAACLAYAADSESGLTFHI